MGGQNADREGEQEETQEAGADNGGARESRRVLSDRSPLSEDEFVDASQESWNRQVVLKRIGDRELFIGDVESARPEMHDRSFETVVSLTLESEPLTDVHHPLKDGPGNTQAAFDAAVDDAREALRSEGTVLIHCAAGISRSTTVLSTAVAAEEDREFDEVVEEVRESRSEVAPNAALRYLARQYLDEMATEWERRVANRKGQMESWSRSKPDPSDGEGEQAGEAGHQSMIDRIEAHLFDGDDEER